jgi:DNA-binding NarL/FixJ family response regulator
MRLCVVDDSPMFTRGLELLLPAVSEQRIQVVGSTDEASAAAALVHRAQPDLTLVNLVMPAPGGLRAVGAIRRLVPDSKIVTMAQEDDDEQQVRALRAGALGHLRKTSEPEELVSALLAVVDGWAVVPRALLASLLKASECPDAAQPGALSEQERTLWRLIAEGTTIAGIARRIHVSERTAKRLVAGLLQRLQVASRTEAAVLAGSIGLLRDGEPRDVRQGRLSDTSRHAESA